MFLKRLLLAWIILFGTAPLHAASTRDRLFDDGWRFFRGDMQGAEAPGFDDTSWRQIDLPHDWSIEDLEPAAETPAVLEAVIGEWRFHRGDDPAWNAPDLDDGDWETVMLPATWEQHSGYTEDNVYGWYRRRIAVPGDLLERDFDLLLGRIDDIDEVWFNGVRIGGSGSFPPNYQSSYDSERRYRVPAAIVRGDGTDLIAVRVFDSTGEGGIYTNSAVGQRIGPFDPGVSENQDRTGYVLGGIGWYRKSFTLDEPAARVLVRFDGVYMNPQIWINGVLLGEHPYGYTSFEYDLTPHLNAPGEPNVLAVRVRNEGRNTRWYSGSGIYRHVWLTQTGAIHVPTWGVFVTTPEVSREAARVQVSVEVGNATAGAAETLVRTTLRDADGRAVASGETTLTVGAGAVNIALLDLNVDEPQLWSVDRPYLHTAEVEVAVDGEVVDTVATTFGIRWFEADAENGLRLNGEPILLKGGCIHHDNGPLGAAAIDRAEERRVELMKANGYNAVRTSHNPPSPAFLDACDRVGILVIDEAFDQWNNHKNNNSEDYALFFRDWYEADIASMVRRDRNHTSVIMWSIGNEIPEQFNAVETQRALREAVLSHDPTRWITQGICSDWGRVAQNWAELSDPAFTHLDIPGYNYLPQHYEADHARHPERVMYGSESYPRDAFHYWQLVEKHPYIIGDFVWTSMDYLGESGIAHAVLSNAPNPFFMPFPWHNAWCGDLDICGFKKPQSYYRDVVWRERPIAMMVHTPIPEGLHEIISGWGWPDEVPSWNWAGNEGTPLQVNVYTRCERVRLLLNGEVVGEQPASDATRLTATFRVPYTPGELRAQGLVGGEVVAETVLQTTGAPAAIRLTADRDRIRADRNDLSYVTVEVVDTEGRRVPDAEVLVNFAVNGDGELAGQASGAPDKPASFQQPQCLTFRGRCIAILRPTGGAGTITLRAEADGLAPATLTVRAE